MMLGAGALAMAACSSGSVAPADGGAMDAASPADASMALPPFVQRLTTSADPSATAPEINLTQWNWNRQIAVDDAGAVHVVWARLGTLSVDLPADRPDPVDTTQLPPGQIFYKRSTDGGQTWTADFALTAAATGTDSATVATSGAYVYVLWRALEAGRLRAFVRSSADGGASWSAPVAVTDNPAGVSVSAPALAADGSGPSAKLYAAWADGRMQTVGGQPVSVKEIYLARSGDHGASWGASSAVSVPDGFSSWTPALAIWSQTIHVAWTDERNDVAECTKGANPCHEEEYYRRSPDDGATWGAEQRLTFDPPGMPTESWAPSMAVWQDSVHLAYLDKRTGYFQVYYRRSTNGGTSFDAEALIAADAMFMNAARPTIAARAGDVHLTWFGFSSFEADIYYSRSMDDGASWSPFLDLTAGADAAGAARIPHIAVAPDHTAHIIWYDTRQSDASGARVELFYGRPNG